MIKKFGTLLITTMFLFGLISLPVKAEAETPSETETTETDKPDSDNTGTRNPAIPKVTYTIRLFAGKQGKFTTGNQEIKTITVTEGDEVYLNTNEVELNNGSKYYIKGVRESGKDNNTAQMSNLVFTAKRDEDYVVAYGLKGNMVEYFVYFVDINGNELAEHQTYYGNVGDKPVVAYLYIDGYVPQTYNLTRTLKKDPMENVFRFIYTPIGGTVTGGTTITEVVPGTTGQTTTQVIDDGTTAVAGGGAGGAAGAGAGAAAADGVTIDEPAVPLDTIDLDNQTEDGVYIEEPSVPLSDMNLQLGPIEMDAQRLLITLVILTATAVIGVASFWYWRPYRKKEKKNDENVARSM